MNIVICVPSYKRPIVETLKVIPSAKIYVSKKEYQKYKKQNPNSKIIAVDDKYQGNVCRIRNRIMDMEKDNIICIIDDDLQYIGYFEKCIEYKINEKEIYDFIYKYAQMAIDIGVRLVGMNINKDKQVYQEHSPFSFKSYIGSPFMIHINQTLRFDERLSLKEDYDFTLQNLNRYRKTLRVNKYHYCVKQKKQTGGVADYRTMAEEKKQLKLLQKKWGTNIVREDKNKSGLGKNSEKIRKFDTNPIIRPPL